MSAVAGVRPPVQAPPPAPVHIDARPSWSAWSQLRNQLPVALAVLNAIAFLLVRPDVNDLWAARARASAVSHGVGLFYWFGWFGGGSTPGNYSVVTPYVCAWLGTEVVGALAAVALTALICVAVCTTRHVRLAQAAGVIAVGINLWSGRVPFLLGGVFAVAAVIAVRSRHRAATVALTALSILASPVSGAFVAVGLSGTFLCTRTKGFRPVIAWAAGTAIAAVALAALAFGAPGPEPFSAALLAELLPALVLLLVARPPDHLRITIWVSVLACLVLFVIPNGLGSNFSRFVWFCLPVAIAATGTARRRTVALAVVPLLLVGSIATVKDLYSAGQPVSSVGYYTSLAHRLDQIPNLDDYRVEVVNHGAHAGYDALLSHAWLARGWETQEDNALNSSLNQHPLPPITYKVWLDNNAVGYVALPTDSSGTYPEYTVVAQHRAPFLRRIWRNADWQLFRVSNATPIAGTPSRMVSHSQSSMTIDVPCRCTVSLRVRWTKFLTARPKPAGSARSGSRAGDDAAGDAGALVRDDGTGWTTLTTLRAGVYELRGSARGLLR